MEKNLKLNIWIEIAPWHLGNNLEFKEIPYFSPSQFVYPCTQDIQRFKIEIEVPYKIEEIPIVKANALPISGDV